MSRSEKWQTLGRDGRNRDIKTKKNKDGSEGKNIELKLVCSEIFHRFVYFIIYNDYMPNRGFTS